MVQSKVLFHAHVTDLLDLAHDRSLRLCCALLASSLRNCVWQCKATALLREICFASNHQMPCSPNTYSRASQFLLRPPMSCRCLLVEVNVFADCVLR